MDARDRLAVDMSAIEQRKERSFGPAIETMDDRPALVAAAARPGTLEGLLRFLGGGANVNDA